MKKRTLYMIGNSHIDPVWFWDWDEGMQEVKATFRSALDRLSEYPEMKFTSTSSAFLEWIEAVAPRMFEEIRQRVKEGRWELTGGWFLEPDCILPCGEAFVRQGLYAQRYLKEKFGIIARTGSNVDSFGHNPMLPQILKKSGMQEYVFMRPRLDTPVFVWESMDGSRVNAISLPSEYTTWFYEQTKEAVEKADEAAKRQDLPGIACCYGVGNHGGGPTRKNLEAVYRLREEMPDRELAFGSYREFFDSLSEEVRAKLPVRRDFFDKVNTGCYLMDGRLKKNNRRAERRLLQMDGMISMDQMFTGAVVSANGKKEQAGLWKTLLFNQFHDTLGGTTIKSARDEAIMQLSKVQSEAKRKWVLAMQHILNQIDTQGEGFPLVLFNPSGREWEGTAAIELNWFCKDGLILKDPDGNEIPYQRVHTQAKVRNYNIGGRRGIVFDAKVPSFGFAVYRTLIGESVLCNDSRESGGAWLLRIGGEGQGSAADPAVKSVADSVVLENEKLRVTFNGEGYLCSLYEKETGYEALSAPVSFPIWKDERDAWGGMQDRSFGDSGERLRFESLQLVEEGSHRKIVRAVYRLGGSILKQDYILYHDASEIEIVNHLYFDREWQQLQIRYPLAQDEAEVLRESAYGIYRNRAEYGTESCMQRFLDVTEKGAGLFIANDAKYAFVIDKDPESGTDLLSLPLARSAIYAQGNGVNWYNPSEGYEYTDIGKQEFTFILRPHGGTLKKREYYRLAERCGNPILYTTDHCHEGSKAFRQWSGLSIPEPNVELGCVKPAEDTDGVVLRLFETEGEKTQGMFTFNGICYPYEIGAYEILTLQIDGDHCKKVNLLEWEDETDG